MSERHLGWLMMMTGPCEAAERSASKEGGVKKSLKPGKLRICEKREFKRLSKSMSDKLDKEKGRSVPSASFRRNPPP